MSGIACDRLDPFAALHFADVANRINAVIDIAFTDGGGIQPIDRIAVAVDNLIDGQLVLQLAKSRLQSGGSVVIHIAFL